MRLDKFIWAVRLFKTRSLATKQCKAGKLKLNDEEAKPSKDIEIGDILRVRVKPFWREYEVIQIPKSRIGAKLVAEHLKEITSEEVIENIKALELENRTNRLGGHIGRPTKKTRRQLDKLNGRE